MCPKQGKLKAEHLKAPIEEIEELNGKNKYLTHRKKSSKHSKVNFA